MTSVTTRPRERAEIIRKLSADIAAHVTRIARSEAAARAAVAEAWAGRYDRRTP